MLESYVTSESINGDAIKPTDLMSWILAIK